MTTTCFDPCMIFIMECTHQIIMFKAVRKITHITVVAWYVVNGVAEAEV
jgi:hypothetical protein